MTGYKFTARLEQARAIKAVVDALPMLPPYCCPECEPECPKDGQEGTVQREVVKGRTMTAAEIELRIWRQRRALNWAGHRFPH